ncbi:MAG TPA: SCO family protein [Verrucomicrobiae bacterium]|jgi:cytochrome oxidase Cu insertion factor (SCO1/SenC/PrrC family)
MNTTPRLVSWLVWGGIALVILAIAIAFVRENSRKSGAVPVLREIQPFTLTNQHGAAVTLDNLHGKVWLAEIIFTRCAGPCLVMTRELAALQKELPRRDDLAFVSLTADPEFDTPAVLDKYAQANAGDASRWQLLTGPKRDLYSLAIRSLLLSVDENPAGKEDVKLDDLFIHSTRLVLVDRRGRLRAYFNGDGTQPRADIATAVNTLLEEH